MVRKALGRAFRFTKRDETVRAIRSKNNLL